MSSVGNEYKKLSTFSTGLSTAAFFNNESNKDKIGKKRHDAQKKFEQVFQ